MGLSTGVRTRRASPATNPLFEVDDDVGIPGEDELGEFIDSGSEDEEVEGFEGEGDAAPGQ